MIKILLVDDHAIMRDGLKQILAGCEHVLVTDEACSGAEALKKIRQHELDIVILDIAMPDMSGIELIKQIKSENPKLPILVLSMYKEKQFAARALKNGASGYLCKDSVSAQLVEAIRKVASGGMFISPEAAQSLALSMVAHTDSLPHTLLSDREYQIFKLLIAGNGITKIADILNINGKTVSTHKARILQKMSLATVSDLVRYAIAHELGD